jgi:hypothetical protein
MGRHVREEDDGEQGGHGGEREASVGGENVCGEVICEGREDDESEGEWDGGAKVRSDGVLDGRGSGCQAGNGEGHECDERGQQRLMLEQGHGARGSSGWEEFRVHDREGSQEAEEEEHRDGPGLGGHVQMRA